MEALGKMLDEPTSCSCDLRSKAMGGPMIDTLRDDLGIEVRNVEREQHQRPT